MITTTQSQVYATFIKVTQLLTVPQADQQQQMYR